MKIFVLEGNAEFDTSEDFEDVITYSVLQIWQLTQCVERYWC